MLPCIYMYDILAHQCVCGCVWFLSPGLLTILYCLLPITYCLWHTSNCGALSSVLEFAPHVDVRVPVDGVKYNTDAKYNSQNICICTTVPFAKNKNSKCSIRVQALG